MALVLFRVSCASIWELGDAVGIFFVCVEVVIGVCEMFFLLVCFLCVLI